MDRRGFKLDINKGYYNKTFTEDGITQIVDTSNQYTYFEVSLYKLYQDIESKEELKEKLITDLLDELKILGYNEIDNLKKENKELKDKIAYDREVYLSERDCYEEFE